MPNTSDEPLVSVVTPCLNAARFIAETIRSVLDQDYPLIEYVVMDGGSTDGTVEILKQYEGRLRYLSAPDRGQADAINRGFELTSGQIFAFLNADDTYLPGAISAVVEAFARHPEAGLVYGDAWYMGEDGTRIGDYPVGSFSSETLRRRCIVCQPAAFVRRDAFATSGRLNAELGYAHDYDLWIRLARRFSGVRIGRHLATSRLHDRAKTVSETSAAMLETITMLESHDGYVPYNWIYGYCQHRLSGESPVLRKPRATFPAACYSLALAAAYNWRHPLRLGRDVMAAARKEFS